MGKRCPGSQLLIEVQSRLSLLKSVFWWYLHFSYKIHTGIIFLILSGPSANVNIIVCSVRCLENIILIIASCHIYQVVGQIKLSAVPDDFNSSDIGVGYFLCIGNVGNITQPQCCKSKLFSIGWDVYLLSQLVHIDAGSHRNGRFARFTPLGGYEHNAIGCPGSIYRGGGRLRWWC